VDSVVPQGEVIWGGRIGAAKINAEHARQRAKEAAREADHAEAYAWVATHGGLRRPRAAVADVGQCLNGGLGWLEVECNPCNHPPAARYADQET
jgi:hypothetical protein